MAIKKNPNLTLVKKQDSVRSRKSGKGTPNSYRINVTAEVRRPVSERRALSSYKGYRALQEHNLFIRLESDDFVMKHRFRKGGEVLPIYMQEYRPEGLRFIEIYWNSTRSCRGWIAKTVKSEPLLARGSMTKLSKDMSVIRFDLHPPVTMD